ncbi:hypothetical protein [Nonomuraea sp. NPDC049028]|uniref:hypothetical protein n=1 Tax=Nonomuraea sp. NPDC049028 TaxID=3364348 RepID=UPI00371BAF18
MTLKIALACAAVAALPLTTEACAADAQVRPAKGGVCGSGLNSEQAANAAAVIRAADDMGMPERATVIAVATTLQESDLDSSTVGDNGLAIGIFQQHPHWGRNRTNPEVSARRFFSHLKQVKGWEDMPLTRAAQAVQNSAFPNAYAKHESRATRIVAKLASHACKEGR